MAWYLYIRDSKISKPEKMAAFTVPETQVKFAGNSNSGVFLESTYSSCSRNSGRILSESARFRHILILTHRF